MTKKWPKRTLKSEKSATNDHFTVFFWYTPHHVMMLCVCVCVKKKSLFKKSLLCNATFFLCQTSWHQLFSSGTNFFLKKVYFDPFFQLFFRKKCILTLFSDFFSVKYRLFQLFFRKISSFPTFFDVNGTFDHTMLTNSDADVQLFDTDVQLLYTCWPTLTLMCNFLTPVCNFLTLMCNFLTPVCNFLTTFGPRGQFWWPWCHKLRPFSEKGRLFGKRSISWKTVKLC